MKCFSTCNPDAASVIHNSTLRRGLEVVVFSVAYRRCVLCHYMPCCEIAHDWLQCSANVLILKPLLPGTSYAPIRPNQYGCTSPICRPCSCVGFSRRPNRHAHRRKQGDCMILLLLASLVPFSALLGYAIGRMLQQWSTDAMFDTRLERLRQLERERKER